ncbi:FAD-linked oxidase-like protein [Hygrophoropsis aurantiaca]|uniref:FAD-linked oxidase-like protein n=1 Tax=Hygrophoropsis aurantiaca TaxID=72124 RepID=A0ACB8AQL6_9AGAM|nr:FAD-linked oxidase-like protein [Hygrophoropsis aurantiaca]
MTFTISRLFSLTLAKRLGQSVPRPQASSGPGCINTCRPLKSRQTTSKRPYSTMVARPSGSLVSFALVASGASICSAVAGYWGAFRGAENQGKLITETLPTIQRDFESPKIANFVKAIEELREAFPEPSKVSTSKGDLYAYAQSSYSQIQGLPHAVVVHVQNTEDVVKVVKISNRNMVPLVPYSGGTSLEGNLSAPLSGSVCVDLSGLDQILAINEADADVVCQAGVTWNNLNDTLKEKGIPLFFPLDPGRDATIGGMISTGCSGTNAVKYGTARGEWILNATVVLPSGEVIKTRQRARKSSAGFDVTKLFIGAEGTLGIVTEATLRLAPVLPSTVAVAQFPDIRQATNAVCDILNRGAAVQCVEIIDELTIKVLNQFGTSTRTWPEKATLFFKFQGSADAIRETSNLVKAAIEKHNATGYELALSDEESESIWADRRNALFAALAYQPGSKGWITDVCVPVSRLPDLIYAAKKDFEELGLVAPIAGHVGDGNFHALVLYRNDEELALVREAVGRINRKAIELDGTCTGEHGVGTGKRDYLPIELGEGTVALMRQIKQSLDPNNLFNPGKLYPDLPSHVHPPAIPHIINTTPITPS